MGPALDLNFVCRKIGVLEGLSGPAHCKAVALAPFVGPASGSLRSARQLANSDPRNGAGMSELPKALTDATMMEASVVSELRHACRAEPQIGMPGSHKALSHLKRAGFARKGDTNRLEPVCGAEVCGLDAHAAPSRPFGV
ncbi:hypothetical protein [Mesorhizobium sp. M0019]|uniref:hypothetical protein n=1 Tax=Mesorhizobium sp. M0019 TaxID=2956845 RepID=UPI003336DC8B